MGSSSSALAPLHGFWLFFSENCAKSKRLLFIRVADEEQVFRCRNKIKRRRIDSDRLATPDQGCNRENIEAVSAALTSTGRAYARYRKFCRSGFSGASFG